MNLRSYKEIYYKRENALFFENNFIIVIFTNLINKLISTEK